MTDITIPVQAPAALPAPAAPAAGAAAAAKPARIGRIARSAGLRSARTFTQSFLAVLTAGPVLNLNVNVFKAAATAGLAAVLTLAQRMLDETDIPTIPAG